MFDSLSPALNRRQSLAGGSAAVAAALIAQLSRRAIAQTSGGMRFGLVTYQWGKDMSLAEVISSCEESGVLGVELRTEHKHAVEPSLSRMERAEVRKRFADSSVELVGYGSNCEFHSDDPAKVKQNIEQAKAYIELMHDCGGSGVKVKPNGFPKGLSREKTIEQIGKSLNEVAEFGQKYGQKIRVEVHGSGTCELPAMRDIFEVADHRNVYVCWNSNDQDTNGEGLEANFRMVQDRIGDTVHVRELDAGDYPYDQLFKLFQQMNYEGWILLEARTNPVNKVQALLEQRHLFEKMSAG
ncbi:MAG: sugar phosphate isomerase/epimerase [Pirellulaceae bacterium]|jgi:sugar phosphate isomerase/epimerase|nr:sugar phosphate isomerase/epimerase [Pirellulaceae bacterium]